jgi:hypothetical protein
MALASFTGSGSKIILSQAVEDNIRAGGSDCSRHGRPDPLGTSSNQNRSTV